MDHIDDGLTLVFERRLGIAIIAQRAIGLILDIGQLRDDKGALAQGPGLVLAGGRRAMRSRRRPQPVSPMADARCASGLRGVTTIAMVSRP
jgi:hypothetical protein